MNGKKATYLTFGDSITFGHDGITHAHPMARPYPMQVGNILGLEVINKAVSGATLAKNDRGLCCMSERILSYTTPADIVSLMIGVNDYQTDIPLGKMGDADNSTFYGALELSVKHILETHKGAFVFLITPFKAKIKGKMYTECYLGGYPLEKIRDAIVTMGEKYSLPVLDMFNLGRYEDIEMMNPKSDGLHPSEEFFENYAVPVIVEFLRKKCPKIN